MPCFVAVFGSHSLLVVFLALLLIVENNSLIEIFHECLECK